MASTFPVPTIEDADIKARWKTLLLHPDEMAAGLTIAESEGWKVHSIVECRHTHEHAAYLRKGN